jgi:phosphatidylglycerol lysyltransferase
MEPLTPGIERVSDEVANPLRILPLTGDVHVGDLIARYATASTAYQVLNNDIQRCVVNNTLFGFKKALGWTIVAGEPVGPSDEQAEAMAIFESQSSPVAYFMAERVWQERHAHTHPYRVYLGSQPVWTPEDWDLAMTHPSLRYQRNRAKNKGLILSEITADEAAIRPDLQQLRRSWLAHHGLPPMHFLVESDVFGNPGERRFFCARLAGEIVGLLVLAPVFQREGYLVEVSLRHPKAPNGTIEYLIDYVFRSISGIKMLTLGLSPLRQDALTARNPFWIRLLFGMLRRFGAPFYDFAGLNRFKEKCRPGSWEPLFLVSRYPITPRMLAAIATVFFK